MKKQCKFFLSQEAIYDIIDTEFHIITKFGYEESNKYHNRIKLELQKLAYEAEMYKSAGYMYRGFTIYFKTFSPAIIFWIIENEEVNVLRILREEFDWNRYFSEASHIDYEFIELKDVDY